jgi:hypothetical protein
MEANDREIYLYQMRYAQYLFEKHGTPALGDLEAYEIAKMERIWDGLGAKEGRSLEKLVELLWKGMGEDFSYSIDATKKGEISIRCTACPFATMSIENGMKEVGFSKYCMSDYGIVKGFNPKIVFTRTKTLMEGQECCDHRYRLEAD